MSACTYVPAGNGPGQRHHQHRGDQPRCLFEPNLFATTTSSASKLVLAFSIFIFLNNRGRAAILISIEGEVLTYLVVQIYTQSVTPNLERTAGVLRSFGSFVASTAYRKGGFVSTMHESFPGGVTVRKESGGTRV